MLLPTEGFVMGALKKQDTQKAGQHTRKDQEHNCSYEKELFIKRVKTS